MRYRDQFRVEPGCALQLDAIDPSFKDKHESKEAAATELAAGAVRLRELQYMVYAERRRWKISESDYTERKLWPAYRKAYEEAIARTSTDHAPWYVIPANHKWFRNLAISSIVVETLESLGMALPQPTVDIADIRRRYHEAADEP